MAACVMAAYVSAQTPLEDCTRPGAVGLSHPGAVAIAPAASFPRIVKCGAEAEEETAI
jgi:hypothetical protein